MLITSLILHRLYKSRFCTQIKIVFSCRWRYLTNSPRKMVEYASGLHRIELDAEDKNPFNLFKKWQNEVIEVKCLASHVYGMCLATTSTSLKPSNRNVFLKRVDHDGFVFVTVAGSRKTKEISENPNVAATFMWNYMKDGSQYVKQVRIQGKIFELSKEESRELFNLESFMGKVRANVCDQDQLCDWEVLKCKHDRFIDDIMNKRIELTMPSRYLGYRIVPELWDFYASKDHLIADRLQFAKVENGWKFDHVVA